MEPYTLVLELSRREDPDDRCAFRRQPQVYRRPASKGPENHE
jgi:hypothetical protein